MFSNTSNFLSMPLGFSITKYFGSNSLIKSKVFCINDKAPRGSKTGTQGLKGNYERSMVPKELVDDIYIAVNSWGLFKKNKIY